MNGSFQAGSISQNVFIGSGSQAMVNFYLAGNPDDGPVTKTLEVSLIGQLGGVQTFTFNTSLATHSNMGWVFESALFSIVTPGLYTLQFASVGDPNGAYGPALAEVSMSSVPDGGMTLGFLGMALVGVAGFRRFLK